MLRKFASLPALVMAALMIGAPVAQAEGTRVAVVNFAKVLEDAPQAVKANKRLEKEFEPRNRSLVNMQKKLRGMEERIQREGVTMSDAQVRKLENDVRNLKRDIRRTQEDYRDDLNIRRNDELRKLQKRVYDAIVELAKKEKYDVVVGDGVIYAADSADITDQVLKLLSAEAASAKDTAKPAK